MFWIATLVSLARNDDIITPNSTIHRISQYHNHISPLIHTNLTHFF
ncbi:hypothetical protein ACWIUD_00805 [Helicobacter sp. 23-1044]